MFGLDALLASRALGGSSRSRATGLTTSLAAGLGIALVSGLIIGIG